MEQDKAIWFKNWFDSPYYHILYKNRDNYEAEYFMDTIVNFLNPLKNSRILDLACGKGRHAIYLNKKGFDVTGLDLSANSIQAAQEFENETLKFYVHDMRKLFRTNYFDYVFNLFTSIGYFCNENDNYAAFSTIQKSLKPGGKVIIDFFNTNKVIEHLPTQEVKTIDEIQFYIKKTIENNFIKKEIRFDHSNNSYYFTEYVQALTQADFEKYLSASGLKIVNLFGDYTLNNFNKENSDRLIIIAQKEK